jgi:fused signal recognition particle receptor
MIASVNIMAQWFSWRKKGSLPEGADDAAVESMVQTAENGVEPVREEKATTVAEKGRWRRGLLRLRAVLVSPLDRLFRGRLLHDEVFDELEAILLGADVGVQTTAQLVNRLRERCRRDHVTSAEVLREYLKQEILSLLERVPNPPLLGPARPWVILVVGINGVGKTTTIAKLAAQFGQQRKKVLLVAADTFRAAAIEQLKVWAERLNVDLVKHRPGASPAAVAFDGIHAAVARGVDVVLIDTAGRLHTKTPLMEELKKVYRVVKRELPGAPHETLLVLDATTGQNALSQAQMFKDALPLSGVILAKLDGSAKGGVVLAIVDRLGIPLRCVGLGEQPDDLQTFRASDFVSALFPSA